MKVFLKHLSVLAFLLVGCFALSGCISHWFEDSTTRLQIENRTGADIIEIDIISEDGRLVRPWIQDTIKDSSVSRVYEEDWVGDFRGQILYLDSRVEKGYFDISLSGGSLYLVFKSSKYSVSSPLPKGRKSISPPRALRRWWVPTAAASPILPTPSAGFWASNVLQRSV